MLTAIVAVSPNWGIGRGDELLYKDTRDLYFFSAYTQEKNLIVGYRTAKTLPRLANRTLWVIDNGWGNRVEHWSSHELGEKLLKETTKNSVLIGGAKTYKLFAPYVEKIYVTHFCNPSEKEADVFFPIEDYPWIKKENGVKIVSNKEFEIVLYSKENV